MKFNTNPVRGTVDYLPAEMETISFAKEVILKTFKQNGFLEVKTPILENLELLTSGDSGDNQKLMFKTIKRGEKLNLSKPNLTESDVVEEGLRYDLTVPLVRLFANNREKLPYPFKSIQIDEAFRAERPQRGRVRQFTQCDIDIIGDDSPLAEIELLVAGISAYKNLGFKNLTVKINDRRVLNQLIVGAGFDASDILKVCINLDKFDKIGEDGVASELLNCGFEKEKVSRLILSLKTLKSSKTNDEAFENLLKIGILEEVVSSLKLIIGATQSAVGKNFKILFDVSIIRGQGYYTGTIYEVFDDDFGRAIGGGGRYDNMVEKFTGVKTSAVGFSIGFYSTVMLLNERNIKLPNKKLALVFEKNLQISEILSMKQKFIDAGYEVSLFAMPKNFNNFIQKIKASGYGKLVKSSNIQNVIEI